MGGRGVAWVAVRVTVAILALGVLGYFAWLFGEEGLTADVTGTPAQPIAWSQLALILISLLAFAWAVISGFMRR